MYSLVAFPLGTAPYGLITMYFSWEKRSFKKEKNPVNLGISLSIYNAVLATYINVKNSYYVM